MDFTKFVSLLEKKALFFPRIDKLGDPFEGSTPFANKLFYEARWARWAEDTKRLQKSGAEDKVLSLRKELEEKLPPFMASHYPEGIMKEVRKDVYVNSWYLNEYESAAMWNLYLKSNEGIAIQSTYNHLKNCFKNNKKETVYIGQIKYIDYKKDIIWPNLGGYAQYMHKRKSFEHEKELRALVWKSEPDEFLGGKPRTENGIYVSANLNTLIEKIVVSPESPQWVATLVKNIVKRYGIRKRVEISNLNARPIF